MKQNTDRKTSDARKYAGGGRRGKNRGMEGVVFYIDWWDAICGLPEEMQLDAVRAVMDYAFRNEEPEDAMLRFATAQIRVCIDRDRKRYEEIRDKRREAGRRRWNAEADTDEDEREQKGANECKCMQTDANACKREQTDADECKRQQTGANDSNYNGNGIGNCNCNGKDNFKEKESKKKTAARFSTPTLKEIKAYVEEKKFEYVNCEKFYLYYESCGWTVGKNKPMKDWRAAVAKWNLDEIEKNTDHGTATDSTDKYSARRGTPVGRHTEADFGGPF